MTTKPQLQTQITYLEQEVAVLKEELRIVAHKLHALEAENHSAAYAGPRRVLGGPVGL
ncbi:MAG: hypothetical protein AAF555_01995 [Verrucomicrobiota bacterium]